MREEWNKYLLGKAELQRIRLRGKRKFKHGGVKGVGVYNGVVQNNVQATDNSNNTQKQEQDALLAAAAQLAAHEREVIGDEEQKFTSKGVTAPRTKGGARGRGRGRGRARSEALNGLALKKKGKNGVQVSLEHQAEVIEGQLQGMKIQEAAQAGQKNRCGNGDALQDRNNKANVVEESREGEGAAMKTVPPVHYYALESEQRILEVVKPHYVIVYDPEMGFVRQLEVFKAQYPSQPLKVYFLLHDGSTEAQKFEASIRRENSSFESLIREKATMMIPVDQVWSLATPSCFWSLA
jgi:DNA excision repair protein ERCC-4